MAGAALMLAHQVASKAVRDSFFLSNYPASQLPKAACIDQTCFSSAQSMATKAANRGSEVEVGSLILVPPQTGRRFVPAKGL
jgi:hypothetical protein